MKNTLRWLTGVALVALAATPGVRAQSPNRAVVLLEAAIQKEVVDGDLRGAIAQYEDILARFPDERAVAVRALWHLGQGYERRSDSRARKMYERLLRDYSDFADLASAARTRLAALVDAPMNGEVSEIEVNEVVDRERRSTSPTEVRPSSGNNANFVIFSDLAVHNTQTGQSRRLTNGARSAAYPVLSPNNQQVAYLSLSGDLQESLRLARLGQAGPRASAELRTVRMDGTEDRAVLRKNDVPWLRPFAWSPNSQQILTVLERANGSREIALVDTTDSSTRTLGVLQGLLPVAMSFSPDGGYIAYEAPTPRNSGELEFFLFPVERPAQTPPIERRYALSLGGQRAVRVSPDQSVVHVLNRLGFGPRLGDIERVKAMGIDAYIEQQLHPERIPDPIVDAKLANFTSLKMTLPQLLEKAGPPVLEGLRRRATLFESREMADRAAQAKPGSSAFPPRANEPPGATYLNRPVDLEIHTARLIRAIYSERQLQEVMVDFWMNHFNVNLKDDQIAPDFEQNAIRRHTFGMFEDLLLSVAKHPKMLFYLDNWRSSAPADVLKQRIAGVKATGSPDEQVALRERVPFLEGSKGLNENYGRELLELHTVGVNGGYTQQDVIAAAKILTGWTISGRGIINGREDDGAFAFDPIMHVEGDKVVLGQTFKSGGVEEGEQLVKMLAHHPSTARFLSTKLARRFIADDPPEAVITAASRTFLQTGGNIREVVKTILMSPQFRSSEALGAKIKKPLELVVSSLRAVKAEIDFIDAEDRVFFQFLNPRTGWLAQMGEKLYAYEAPDGNPDVGAAWINSNALLVRLDFANALTTNELPGVRVNLASARLLLDQLGLPNPTPAQVEQTRAMLQKQGGPTPRSSIPQSMMMAPGAAPGGAAQAAAVDPTAIIVATMLGSPQFQKR